MIRKNTDLRELKADVRELTVKKCDSAEGARVAATNSPGRARALESWCDGNHPWSRKNEGVNQAYLATSLGALLIQSCECRRQRTNRSEDAHREKILTKSYFRRCFALAHWQGLAPPLPYLNQLSFGFKRRWQGCCHYRRGTGGSGWARLCGCRRFLLKLWQRQHTHIHEGETVS